MHIKVDEARALVERVMTANQHSAEDARIIADHIVDCELRGLGYGLGDRNHQPRTRRLHCRALATDRRAGPPCRSGAPDDRIGTAAWQR